MKKMFSKLVISALLFMAPFTTPAFAQSVGIGTDTPNASAILDIKSTDKGLLIPRMSKAEKDAIVNPVKGLMVYVTEDSSLYIYQSKWHRLVSFEDELWSTKGNTGTDPDFQFIGTTDDKPLRFRVKNTMRMQVDSSGRLLLKSPGYNLFIGEETGLNTTGTENYFIGNLAGSSNTSGQQNQFTGNLAGYVNTTGSQNFFDGYGAGYQNTTGRQNYFSGFFAGFSDTASFNHFTGYQAGYSNKSGHWNSFNGYQAGYYNTEGYANDFNGYKAGLNNTTGFLNYFSGYRAGISNTTGTGNVIVGGNAGLFNTTGLYNSFVGCQAGFNNTTGSSNQFTGLSAGFDNTTGSDNCFNGNNAGSHNRTGSQNTIIGINANVVYDTLTNAGAIGFQARVSRNNSFVIGGLGSFGVNVGIGTDAPLTKLDVNSNESFSDIATFRSTGGWGQILINQGTTVTDLGAYETGGFTGTHSAGDFKIRTGSTDRMFFQHSTGNVGIGTLSPLEKLDVNGRAQFSGGIKLPTPGGTPAVLDYYEEYTLTGNLHNSSSTNYVLDYSIRITRVGKQVTITFPATIQTITIAGGVADIIMSNIPARFCPVIEGISFPIRVKVNSVWGTGVAVVGTDGNIYLKPSINDPAATWGGIVNNGFSAFAITFSL